MSTPINLNKVRKARAKSAKRAQADASAAAFGRSKADKQAAAKESARVTRQLDGKALEARGDGAEPDVQEP